MVTEEIFDIFGYPSQKLSVYNDIQYLRTSFEPIKGNLEFRSNILHSIKEEFVYDLGYDRLTGYQVVDLATDIYLDPLEVCYNSGDCTGSDQAGNIMYKTDVGEYTYGNVDKPNAVTEVTDPNNLIGIDGNQNAIFNGFNSVESISQGDLLINFTYGVDQQRRKSELFVNNELARKRYYIGNFEKEIAGTQTTEVTNVTTPNGHTVMYVEENNGVGSFYFKYTDHLGSILKVTDINGNIVASQNFDPYGRYRDPVSWTYLENSPMTDGTLPSWLWRGYTGHEHLDEFGLVNMNGRLYDPLLARMLSPDNYVQDPENPQSYNRYSYVWNNPLKYVDPSGELVDDYRLDDNGNITLIKKTDDKFDRLIATKMDGSLNEEDAFIINKESADDETILTSLAEDEFLQLVNQFAELSQGRTDHRNVAYSLFNFVASNSSAEWSLAHSRLQGKDNYSLGTFQLPALSPSFTRYNLSLDNMVSQLHSHPDPGVGELESMGVDSDGNPYGGDWSHEIDRYYKNGSQTPFYSAVYFPDSGRLFNVQAARGPVFIRNIKNNYKRFFYGRL